MTLAADPTFDRALARARRHSRRVRFMRAALPVIAVLGIGAFVALAWVRSLVPDGLSVDGLKVEGGELVMENPSLRGFDERDQPYAIDAERATQNVADPDRFRLTEVLADIPLPDGRRVTVLSAGGDYDKGAELLSIPEPFTVMVNDGTIGTFEGGTVDIERGAVESRGAVDIRNPEARIRADRLRVERAGRTATFTGNVRVTIEPGSAMAPPTMRDAGTSGSVDAPAISTIDELRR